MNRLRFAYRFLLIGAAGGLLIIGLLAQFLVNVGTKLDTTRREMAGARMLVPLRQMNDTLHELASALTLASAGSSDEAVGKQAKAATYYLNDTLITQLPQLLGILSQTRLKAAYIAEIQMIDAGDKGRLDKLMGDAQVQFQRVRESLGRTASDGKSPFETGLAKTEADLKALQQFINDQIIFKPDVSTAPAEVLARTGASIASAIQESTGQAREVAQALAEASDSVQRTTDGVNLIADAVHEQIASSQQITGNVEKIADMAARNNQAVARAANEARRMEGLSDGVMQEIGRFRV